LKLTDDQFLDLTPRQLQLLNDRHKEQTDHEELLAGIIASTLANYSFAGVKKPLVPADFMPSQWAKKKPKKERPNRKRIAQNIRNFMQAQVRGQEIRKSKQ
jgi:hypothetical protein